MASRRSFCDYLVRARRQRNMSIDEISGVTRIPVRSLERLESGKFEELPGDVFVRGFLRSYARCVGLDAEETIRRYTNCGMTPAPVASPMADELASSMATLEEYCNACVRQVTPPPGRRARTAHPEAPADHAASATTSPAAPAADVQAAGSMPISGPAEPAEAGPTSEDAAQHEAAAQQDARPSAPKSEAQGGRPSRKRKRKRKRQRRQATEHQVSRQAAPAESLGASGAPEEASGTAPGAPDTERGAAGSPEPPAEAPETSLPAPARTSGDRPAAAVPGAPATPQAEDHTQASRSSGDTADGARDPAGAEPGPRRQPAPVALASEPASRSADPSANHHAGVRATARPVPAGARSQRGRAHTRMPTAATRPVLVIDDEHPEDAERAQEERAARSDSSSWRSLLPPALLDGEEGSNRSTLTLAVIILVIVATLTMSYLLRRPDVSGDGITWQRALPGTVLGHDTTV